MNFEQRVKQYIDQNGCTLANAIGAIAVKYQTEHADYLKRLKAGATKSFFEYGFHKPAGTYEKRVRKIMDNNPKLSQKEAQDLTAKIDPQAHAEFSFRTQMNNSKSSLASMEGVASRVASKRQNRKYIPSKTERRIYKAVPVTIVPQHKGA
jgi:hypothetical protein